MPPERRARHATRPSEDLAALYFCSMYWCCGDLQRILGTFDMRQDVAHEVGKVRLKCVIAFVILRLQQGVQDFDERPVGYALTIGRAASLEYAGVEQVVSR